MRSIGEESVWSSAVSEEQCSGCVRRSIQSLAIEKQLKERVSKFSTSRDHLPDPSLTWNLKMMVSKRNLLFQGAILNFGRVSAFISLLTNALAQWSKCRNNRDCVSLDSTSSLPFSGWHWSILSNSIQVEDVLSKKSWNHHLSLI